MRTRVALAALGVAAAVYGAWLLVSRQDVGQLVEVAAWLVAGVVSHDALLSGLLLGLGVLGTRLLPPGWRSAAAVGLVVWGSLTIVAVPVLGRFGARPDNLTLLDRPYLTSWLVLSALGLVAVVVAGLVRSRRHRAQEE